MRNVVAYPHGFVAYNVGWPVRQIDSDLETKLAAVRLMKAAQPKEKTVISNPIVEELFEAWRTKRRSSNDVSFIEDVMAAAVHAFGTTDMYEWCYMQTLSPYFTAHHRRFMNETFDFIETGKRRFSHPTWLRLLQLELANPMDAKEFYGYQDFFRVKDPVLLKPRMDIFAMVERWLSQPGGIDDLVQTLHVFFGENP